MDLDWCIRCDKHTKGGLYCSEACQREDYAQTSQTNKTLDPLGIPRRPVSVALASPTLSSYNLSVASIPSQQLQQQHTTPSSSPEYLTPKRSLQPVVQRRTTSQPHSLVNSHLYDATSRTSPSAVPACATTAAALLRQKILGYHQGNSSSPSLLSTNTATTTTTTTAANTSLRPLPAQRSISTSNIKSTSSAYHAGYVPSL
ncbi:hypothetical protein BDF22DRAFT_745628 [Syncephalis plumigaleata]|nr:hypothetical protein BDF22DRAFT_745628 [Syncephalis plumigaleata]